MQREYLTDGELGFVGLNSRDNPATLPKGYVSVSKNFRLSRGVATVRKGLKKFTTAELYGPTKKVVGSGSYLDNLGQERIIVLVHDSEDDNTRAYKFDPNTPDGVSGFSSATLLPQKIRSSEGVEIIQAIDKIFISRGHDERPLVWDLISAPTVIPINEEFPSSSGLLFCQNRIIAKGRHLLMADVARKRDTVCVSHFLQYDKWKLADAFTINQGGNDEVVSIVPWTMNEFLILCRNSTFYLNVGSDRYVTGAALSTDARLESLSVDVGCSASKSAVQVGGGVVFLSDNGVYELKPTQTGVPDGVKLLTLSEPLSAPIDDVIKRINKPFATNATGIYWDNRYFLAVPLDGSEKNNAVLVYNFILRAWESVDVYLDEVNIASFITAKRGNQRRLFIIDHNEGVLLTEELGADEFGPSLGTPILKNTPTSGPYAGKTGEYLPFKLTEDGFSTKPVEGLLVTRSFTLNEGKAKRFSSVETDMSCPSGSIVTTYAVTTNPDTESKIDEFVSLSANNLTTTRRNPVRKIAYGLQIKFVTSNLQPTIRSNFVKFTINSKTNQNKT